MIHRPSAIPLWKCLLFNPGCYHAHFDIDCFKLAALNSSLLRANSSKFTLGASNIFQEWISRMLARRERGLDLQIQASRPQECGVKNVDMIRGRDNLAVYK